MDIKKWLKKSSGRPNNPEAEQEFREICLLYGCQCSSLNRSLSQDYQEILNNYHKITSLYITEENDNNNSTKLIVYDTESEIKEVKILNTPKQLNSGTCITQLSNGDLFCFGRYPESGITLIIDKNYEVRILPSGNSCWFSSCIFFNNSVYCFGGEDDLALSSKFDLDKNRWINLTPMPKADAMCHNLVVNENILISGWNNTHLLLYAIEIDSFSTIPYDFTFQKRKILINIGKLYLIECDGLIYESEDEYNWIPISKSIISDDCACQIYCSYNKGGIYISNSEKPRYYKFDLSQKTMTVLRGKKFFTDKINF